MIVKDLMSALKELPQSAHIVDGECNSLNHVEFRTLAYTELGVYAPDKNVVIITQKDRESVEC